MPGPAADLAVTVEVGLADPVTADDVLAEFSAAMREWRFAPFAHPLAPQVMCPLKMLTRAEAEIAAAVVSEYAV